MTPRFFAVVVAAVLIVLVVLGWMLIRQEMQLGEERRRDRLDSELLAATERLELEYQQLQQRLAALETTGIQQLWPVGVTVRLSEERLTVVPRERLLYLPRLGEQSPDPVLDQADRLELARDDPSGARKLLMDLLDDESAERRGGALLRLARIARKLDQSDAAALRYRALTDMIGVSVEGTPAAWLGWYGLCSIPDRDREAIAIDTRECARALAASMKSGSESTDAATYAFYLDVLGGWGLPADVESPPTEDALSEAVRDLDETREEVLAGRAPESGLSIASHAGSEIVTVWQVVDDRMWAIAAPAHQLIKRWLPADRFLSSLTIYAVAKDGDVRSDTPGLLAESMPVTLGGRRFVIQARETNALKAASGVARRQFVLSAILILVALTVGASLFVVSRALRQEFEVARLQSEFVAAVSHEFRTPLTSMRQLTEMLASGRVTSPERIQRYYQMLDREASRLTRLVESLLNFGRMETGGFTYDLEHVDIDELAGSVIADFRQERNRDVSRTGRIQALVHVDADMISLALWNLLDNADKYAPQDSSIAVDLSSTDSEVRIAVSDQGPGVPPSEQGRIFDKFVRASEASDTSVKGTGLGLALVRRIMEDHGGSVRLDASSSEGSTFSLYLKRDDDAHSDR